MYEPQVDDYVKWTTSLGMVHEGWVYFKCDYTPKKKGFPHSEHYITIELGVNDMPTEQQRLSLIHISEPTRRRGNELLTQGIYTQV